MRYFQGLKLAVRYGGQVFVKCVGWGLTNTNYTIHNDLKLPPKLITDGSSILI